MSEVKGVVFENDGLMFQADLQDGELTIQMIGDEGEQASLILEAAEVEALRKLLS